jgi:hypothetical protein
LLVRAEVTASRKLTLDGDHLPSIWQARPCEGYFDLPARTGARTNDANLLAIRGNRALVVQCAATLEQIFPVSPLRSGSDCLTTRYTLRAPLAIHENV